ncbi:MAG: alpha/beta hydrolase [Selenomonadaceae bacterium]|nr:alpha/beta hydrolase [Selenomonadaceae bacterium]
MKKCNVTEDELRRKKIIPTDFGENLSWEYFSYVRKNPVNWKVPTKILYGEKDFITPLETLMEFAEKNNFEVTIMKNGEHWFHTEEQMNFLDNWLKNNFYKLQATSYKLKRSD